MILILLRKLLASKYGAHIGLDLAILLIAVASFVAYKHFTHNPITSVVQVTPDVKVVTVDKPVLTEKVVDKIIPDPKDKAVIASLLAENKRLNVDVTQLTQTVAELKTHGGTDTGGTVIVDPPTGTAKNFEFKDWRLFAKYDDQKNFIYDLTQQFEILTTSGRQPDGSPVSLVKLYELDATGARVPVSDVKTTAIFADQTAAHWFTHTNIQAGLALSKDSAGKTSNGGIVALQWLKRGKTKAPEDISFAVLSPTFFFSQDVKEPGLLPFSYNVGRVPHQPLTNLWVSPYVGLDIFGRTLSRLGVVFSATF